MTNEDFISLHLKDDVRQLALKPRPEGVDLPWCLQQIEGYQKAQTKLPAWAAVEGLWFPPQLSMEQCSSQQTSLYKCQQILRLFPSPEERQLMIDLTGGFGVDFSFLARHFQQGIYVERQEILCQIAQHNFPLLGLGHAKIIFNDFIEEFGLFDHHYSLIYLDPARRDSTGRKMVTIEDCTPDVSQLMPRLLEAADCVMVKLSPMLGITQALRSLPNVKEIHVVSVKGECKELLLVCNQSKEPLRYYCVNLDTHDAPISVDATTLPVTPTMGSPEPNIFLYEPNASILKAGVQDAVAQTYSMQKLHPMSNLYVSPNRIDTYPGRCFRILNFSTFNKRNLHHLLADLTQANLTIRNFPSTVADLRRRLKLKEGGTTFLFATTLSNETHCLIRCEKP